MIVGGYALAYHGFPRYTGDINIKPDAQNTSKIIIALNEFGFGSIGIEQEDLESPNKVVQLGVLPIRIDIITSISGLSWDEAYSQCVNGEYGNPEEQDILPGKIKYFLVSDLVESSR